MPKWIVALALSLATTFAAAQPAPTEEISCAPPSSNEIRSGVVGNDHWFYWWCRTPEKVGVVWQGFLERELKGFVMTGAVAYKRSVDPFNELIRWGQPSDRPEMAHLKAAVLAAAAADDGRPVPGEPFPAPTTLPELWNVTPNGALPTRRTNLVQNGRPVAIYGTQTVKVLTPCDCNVVSYPEGSVTKKCPVAGKMVTEVVSCMRLR